MASSSPKSYILSSTIVIVLVTSLNTNDATNQLGFTVKIIHRDSLNSPFYDNSTTPYQKSLNALRQSMKRVTHFIPEIKSFFEDPEANLIPHSIAGDYLMAYSIGTSPSYETVGTLDTGSNLIWLKCDPCKECFDSTAPAYKSYDSITHETYYCYSLKCKTTTQSVVTSCGYTSSCKYEARYAGGGGSYGLIAKDTLILGSISGSKMAP